MHAHCVSNSIPIKCGAERGLSPIILADETVTLMLLDLAQWVEGTSTKNVHSVLSQDISSAKGLVSSSV